MAYLSKRDWQKHIKLKEHSKVKKTGISDILSNYEKAEKKSDLSGQVVALEKLIAKIDENKRKWSDYKTITSYLDSMRRDAKKREDEITRELADTEDEDLEASGDLAKTLEKLRKATEEKPHNFVVAPGKPSTGIIINRRKITNSHIKKAREMRGKGGPFFLGTCFFTGGKFYFDLPDQPPGGLARAIKQAARLHAEMSIKVAVRGGGVEIDDETDGELGEAGEARVTSGAPANYPGAASFDAIIAKINEMPQDKRSGAAGGVVGKIQQLIEQAAGDPNLEPADSKAVVDGLNTALAKVNAVLEPAAQAAPAKYPTMQQWKELLEQCLRLDREKRLPAIQRVEAKWKEVVGQLKADTDLDSTQKGAEGQVLKDFAAILKQRAAEYVSAAKSAHADGNADRLRGLETEFDIARKSLPLSDAQLRDVAGSVLAARKALAEGDAGQKTAALDELERKLKALNATTFQAKSGEDKVEKQTRIHNRVRQGVEVFKKGAFASGTAGALFRDKGDLKIDRGLKKLGEMFQNVEKDASAENLAALSKEGRTYLQAVETGKAKLDPVKDADKIKALEAKENLARTAVQRVRFLELAREMDQIGAPPWNESQTEKMAELQVAYFFEEGALKQNVAEFGAPQLGAGDEKGVNEAWWITRADPDAENPGDGKSGATKTYIFKPQDLEASNLPGIEDKGGCVREVLASTLNDRMIEYGFDVGVCPTYMVEIDSAKLAGLPANAEAKTFGAVQELGANDGPVSAKLTGDTAAFAKSLDHKNISDIAVFDLMFVSLDRHSKNLLVQEGEDGKNTLLPIDHGIGLPDPLGLQLSRSRLTGAQNVMMLEEMRADELLDEETRANLARLDAGKMIADMKAAQLAAEQRHPETAGKFDHREFDRMQARAEFMKAAANSYTSRELTFAIANFSTRINATKPTDMAQLASDLHKEIKAAVEGRKEADILTANSVSKSKLDVVQQLGWATALGPSELEDWASENGDLVARILKTKAENPDAKAEIAELLTEINEPGLKERIAGNPIGKQLEELRSTLSRRAEDQIIGKRRELPGDEGALPAKIEDLGGEAKLEEIRALFPETRLEDNFEKSEALLYMREFDALGGAAEYKLLRQYFTGEPAYSPMDAALYLQDWREINKLGGLKVYAQLGGMVNDNMRPTDALRVFKELKRAANGTGIEEMRTKDASEIERAQKLLIDVAHRTFKENLARIKIAVERAKFEPVLRAAEKAIEDKDWNTAQSNLEGYLSRVEGQARLETEREREGSTRLADIAKLLLAAKQADTAKDFSEIGAMVRDAQKLVVDHDYNEAKRKLIKLELTLDKAVNGADGRAGKLEAAVADIDRRLQTLKAQSDLDLSYYSKFWTTVKGYLDTNLTEFDNNLPTIQEGVVRGEDYLQLFQEVAGFDGGQDVKQRLAGHLEGIAKAISTGTGANIKFNREKIRAVLDGTTV